MNVLSLFATPPATPDDAAALRASVEELLEWSQDYQLAILDPGSCEGLRRLSGIIMRAQATLDRVDGR